MKKLLFLLMVAFSCLQANAALSSTDYSSNNYVNEWGRLTLSGNQLSSQGGQAVQLKGWSTFGLQWQVSCYTKANFEIMKGWGANVVRLAMYVQEGGYANDPDGMMVKVKSMIDWCNELGLYCIVDWHVLTPGNPNDSQYMDLWNNGENKGAVYFFTQISSYVKGKGYKHVLYEICNEPNKCSWSDIRTYADKVLPVIQTNDPGAIVIVGTPQWDQLINEAVSNPITSYSNLKLMYAFHYYACSHIEFLSKLKTAAASIPVFVSEWGAVDFDGNGTSICTSPSDQLMAVCDGDNGGKVKISWCFWQWGDKNELSSSLQNCGNITKSTLRPSGEYILTKLCGGDDCSTPPVSTDGPYGGTAQVIPTPTGGYFEVAYYDLGGEGLAYHDGDGTDYEQSTNCNNGYQYAGDDWSFRKGECVDVSGCYGLSGSYDTYNLNTRENDEWLKYTIDVKEAGYYSFVYLATESTSGTVQFSATKDGAALGNIVYNYNSGAELTEFYLDSYADGISPNAWENWGWTDPMLKSGSNPGISLLFKEAGTYVITMTFPTEGGDLGPLRFTKAAAYSGPGYGTNVESVASEADFSIYPNPTSGVFSIALANAEQADVTIINTIGQTVYSTVISGNSEVSTALASGTYIVTVKTANAVKTQKLVIK